MFAARFPRSVRIRDRREFDHVFRAGESAGSTFFRGLVLTAANARLGIAVPKRCVAKAHDRNRIKRIVREAFRLRRNALPNHAFVIVARGAIATADSKAIRRDLECLFDRLAALKPAALPGTMRDLVQVRGDAP